MIEFSTPSISYAALSPVLIVLGAAVVGVVVEAVAPARARRPAHVVIALGALIAALVAAIIVAGTQELTAAGAIAVDGPALFLQGTLILFGLAAVLLLAEGRLGSAGSAFVAEAAAVPGSDEERESLSSARSQTEVFPLTLFALGGMMVFPAANNLLLMFVALEVLSLPLYLLCGLARRRRLLSQEAAVKYFLLGAFSSAFFLYGVALVYGYAGSVSLGDVFAETQAVSGSEGLLYLGLAMLGVGLLFKVTAAPFHSWAPDVYQGAPTPIVAFMSAATKLAAFGALLRVFYVGFPDVAATWQPVLWGIAILAMVVGAVLAITQTDVKRLLAYSTIAHTGFILTGVVALSPDGLSGSMFYVLAYGFTSIASFGLVSLVRGPTGEATHLRDWRGLGRRSPLVAGLFSFLLLALAGIPLTSGFTAKFAVFSAAIDGGALPLVIVGVVMSTVAAFFYFRVVVLMFFQNPAPDGPTVAVPSVFTATALALGVAVTVVLGVLPGPVLDLAQDAALFVR